MSKKTSPKTKPSPFQRVNRETMNALVLRHLLPAEGGPGHITAIEAQALYKCRSLSRRICDLKAAGYKITTVRKTDLTGQRYVRYYLVGQKPVSYGQDTKVKPAKNEPKRAPGVFKVGDRVRGSLTHHGKDINGRLGTIVAFGAFTRSPLVEFDAPFEGHDGNNGVPKSKLLRSKRGWYVAPAKLVLVKAAA